MAFRSGVAALPFSKKDETLCVQTLIVEYSFLDFLNLLGSLGLFLYGMKIMSEGLQKVAGDRMRSVLSAMTHNRFLGVLTGLLVTALIQSSSGTTLMVVSFVNAGLLSLAQSISVIMGANIGTTVTAWIISLLGFKFDIASFAIPLLALSLPLIFSKKTNWNSWGEFVIGFSLLFLGLQFLKSSMPDLQSNPDALAFLQQYTDMGFGSVLLFLLIGTILTCIVQSSSATVAITLIMCAKGWIPFELGTAMILGENIGTTITANLAALNANIAAKRTAFSHFLFNVLGVIWVLCLYYPIVNIVGEILAGQGPDPRGLYPLINELSGQYTPEQMDLMTGSTPITDNAQLAGIQATLGSMSEACSVGLALFHTLFNVINTAVMIWLIPVYKKICEMVIQPSKKEEKKRSFAHLQFLSTRMLSTSELSLIQVHKEVTSYAKKVREMLRMVQMLLFTDVQADFEQNYNRLQKYENICDRIEVEIVEYLSELSEGDLSSESRREVRILMTAATEIESMGDACYNMGQIIHRRNNNDIMFCASLKKRIQEMHALVEQVVDHTIYALDADTKSPELFYTAENLEHDVNNKRDILINENLHALETKDYEYPESVYYLDLVDEYEHLADYSINVVEAITGKKHS